MLNQKTVGLVLSETDGKPALSETDGKPAFLTL